MALSLFLKNSHLDGNQRRNGECPRPFLQTQVYWIVRFSCRVSGGTECKKCSPPSQEAKASLLNTVIMKRKGQTKMRRVYTQGKSSLKNSSSTKGLSRRMIVHHTILSGRDDMIQLHSSMLSILIQVHCYSNWMQETGLLVHWHILIKQQKCRANLSPRLSGEAHVKDHHWASKSTKGLRFSLLPFITKKVILRLVRELLLC